MSDQPDITVLPCRRAGHGRRRETLVALVAELAATHNDDLVDAWEKRERGD